MAKDMGIIAFGMVKQLEKRVKLIEEIIKEREATASQQIRSQDIQPTQEV